MPKEIRLPKNSSLTGEEYIRAVDYLGRSVIIPISVVQSYVTVNQRFALYDGAVPTVPGPYEQYSEQFSGGGFSHNPRLEFGDLTDSDYWPIQFDPVLKNDLSAPAGTSFDFRTLTLGTFVQFDVEFNLKFGDDSGNRIDTQFVFYYKMIYPNGDIETRTWTMPSDYVLTTPSSTHYIKMSFSTYIKNEETDKLLGGEMEYGVLDVLGGTEILHVKDLIVTAKL